MFEIGSAIGLVKPSPGSAPSAVPDAAIEALKDRERKGVVKPGGSGRSYVSSMGPVLARSQPASRSGPSWSP
jgi:hypothetical protein